jgi:hypothetical protein
MMANGDVAIQNRTVPNLINNIDTKLIWTIRQKEIRLKRTQGRDPLHVKANSKWISIGDYRILFSTFIMTKDNIIKTRTK